jgi:hypothetical protein
MFTSMCLCSTTDHDEPFAPGWAGAPGCWAGGAEATGAGGAGGGGGGGCAAWTGGGGAGAGGAGAGGVEPM